MNATMTDETYKITYLTGVKKLKPIEYRASRETVAMAIKAGLPINHLHPIVIDESVKRGVIQGDYGSLIIE